jgi:hypothetical protein
VTPLAPPVASVAPGTARSLAAAIDSCLHKDPTLRLASGEALADALEPALERRAEVPVPIRSFLDPRKMGTLLWYPLFTTIPAYMFMFDIGRDIERVFGFRPGALVLYGVGLLATSVVIPVALLTKWLRPMLKLGYGASDIASGLRANFDRKREEYLYEFGAAPSRRERALTAVTVATATVNIASWLALYFGSMTPWLPGLIFTSGFIWPITGMLSANTTRIRTGVGSWWAKRWDGAIGRWLTKLASIKLGARAAAADRPTEMAIAFSAEALFDELPKPLRQSLGDVPAVLRQLESQARAIRQRIELLDSTIAEAQSMSARADARSKQEALIADLSETRKQAEQRLAELVTALEITRLDLLRLRAGHGSADSITLNIIAAKALGEDVDRLLSGQAEADAAIRGREKTPV